MKKLEDRDDLSLAQIALVREHMNQNATMDRFDAEQFVMQNSLIPVLPPDRAGCASAWKDRFDEVNRLVSERPDMDTEATRAYLSFLNLKAKEYEN